MSLTEPSRPTLSGPALFAVYAVCAAIVLSPLAWVSVPPLVDFPNHLARAWILTHAASIPELAANYTVNWRVLPDLAMDCVVTALSWVMPVPLAGRCFVALTMLLLVGGTAALHRAVHGRVGLWPLASLFCLYNAVLFWGFVSCLFTVGLALCAFAGWIASRNWPLLPRIALFAAISVVLLLGHLFAFGVYGLLIGSYQLGQLLAAPRRNLATWVRAALPGLQFVPAVALWYFSLAHAGSTHTEYGGPIAKLIALLAPFNFGLAPAPLDAAEWLFGIVVLYAGLSRRWLRVAPGMKTPLIVVAAAAVLMPNWLSGSWNADLRLPVVLPLLVIAATSPQAVPLRVLRPLTLAAVVLLGLRVGAVSQAFADYDGWFSEFRAATAVITPGARLLVVEPPVAASAPALPGLQRALASVQPAVFLHMPALAILDRSALFPYLFAGWTTVDVTPRNVAVTQRVGVAMTPDQLRLSADPANAAQIAAMTNEIGEHPYWRNWPAEFDFVFWMSFDGPPQNPPPQLEAVAQGSYFTIFRVRR